MKESGFSFDERHTGATPRVETRIWDLIAQISQSDNGRLSSLDYS
jgi:hypothetical protein